MKSNYNFLSTVFSFLKSATTVILLLINANTQLSAQIIFTHDTTLTGFHNFTQGVKIVDSTVNLRIEDATVNFQAGLTIERGQLTVGGSTIYFLSGSGLVVSTDAEFYVISPSNFRGGIDQEPGYVTLINSRAIVSNSIFDYLKVLATGKRWSVPPNTPAYIFYKCEFIHDINNPAPLFEGNHFDLNENYFSRWNDTLTVQHKSEYPNISISGQFGRVESCISNYGGIESAWADNRNLEVLNNTIRYAKTGIYCLGVKRIEGNLIENVETGITGGSSNSRLNNVTIANNKILDVTGQAIDVLGDSITIYKNIIKGNGQTAKGISFENCSGWITNNLISDFKISEASFSDDGIALFLNASPGHFRTVVVNGNIFEYCGLSETADPEIVASIVHIKSPVIFTNNELRLNTLGGEASNLFNFAGGPVLNIEVPDNLGPPMTIKYNFIHSNTFVNEGVYEPTQTKGTLVAIELQSRKLEFKSNILYGSSDATLGVYLIPGGFPNGVVGDSLIFEENTIANNYVGVGTMAGPDLSNQNNFKGNTSYHIMRYGGQRDLEMFALNNNWDSGDPAAIDNMLYDDDEASNTGPINFTGYYDVSYDVTPSDPGSQHLNIGDSLKITIRITDLQGNPVENISGFFTSSDANIARITTNEPHTGSDGYITGMLHAYEDGSTDVRVYAGGSVSDPVQINSGEVGVDNEPASDVLEDFKLYQNYPNPFNPVTMIKYQIPKEFFVSVKVYDIIGNEVAVLVNKQQKAGYYELQFDAGSLSSGVYFYRLTSEDFVLTKKMILLK